MNKILKPIYFQPNPSPEGSLRDRPSSWSDPVLDLFPQRPIFPPQIPEAILKHPKLYLVPTPNPLYDEEFDSEKEVRPSPLDELPEINEWVTKYLVGVIETWGGKRPASQLARWTHRLVYQDLLRTANKPPFEGGLPKIRKIYISQPIEGVAETTATLRYGERVRALIMRFEGVDQRWLCTELKLI